MRYHGGKWRLADWIIGFFPPHFAYVEPFGGAAGILMQKPRSPAEVYNDLDDEIVNVFEVLRDKKDSQALQTACVLTPYSRREFEKAYSQNDAALPPVERARRTLFRAFAGYGSAGATKGRTGFRSYAGDKRSSPPVMDWANYPRHIAYFCDRLQGVIIESRPALEVIRHYDAENTLYYVDPPYMHDTRSIRGGRYYRHEMDTDDHVALLDTLLEIKGMVILSGYATDVYNKKLLSCGWLRFDKHTQANGNSGSVQRKESIWINHACCNRGQQQILRI
ncbi:hypothetical protein B1757_02690 [Acidithiobacillus marinus]|uniref:Uncharacterized protein n=2 Tax=Acidithiobacillus marinus TaxID=187490 RepID=A0A2I1DPG7_9PROT|nr:hypothetical protein B1757_02690 [Acidithiobacillus marinus]